MAARHEDCGTCVQIEVNMAKRDRVPPQVIRAAADARPEDLPSDLADVYQLALAVVTASRTVRWPRGQDLMSRAV